VKIETQKHRDAFEEYYATRNLMKVSRKLGISRQSLTTWKREFRWQTKIEDRDKEINDTVSSVMQPQWLAVRVTLIQFFLNQLNEAIKLKVAPENSRDMVAISRELRALLGEGDTHQVEITGIEYILKE